MSMEIREIVYSSVSLQRGGAAQSAFGVKMCVSPHTIFTERSKAYGSAGEMLAGGWNIGDPAYDALAKAFMQKNKPDSFKVGRVQVDVAKGTVIGSGPLTVGTVYAYESADLADPAVTDIEYTVAAITDTANGGATGAGTSNITFLGTAGDALMYRTGYTFSYSGDTTTAANVTYTVKAPGATHLAGTVTVPVVETIVAATFNGSLVISNDKYAVAAGLVAAHTASALLSTAADNSDGTFSLTTAVAGQAFIFRSSDTGKITVAPQTLGGTGGSDAAKWVTSLNAIKAEDPNVYGIIETSRTDAISLAVSGWVETEVDRHIYFIADNNSDQVDLSDTLDTTSLFAVIQSLGYGRTRGLYNSKADGTSSDEWYDAASLTQNLIDIDTRGNSGFYGRDMVGVTPENLSTTQKNNLAIKNIDHCDTINGFVGEWGGVYSLGGGGRMLDGKPCSAVVGSDHFVIRLGESIFNFLHNAYNTGNLPYTQASLNAIRAQFEGVIANEFNLGVFTPDYETYGDRGYYLKFPNIEDVSAADRSANKLTGIEFRAQNANGIHFIYNNIIVSY